MRKILFRGKAKKTGEWFIGNLYDIDRDGRTHICITSKGCLDIDPDTVGQFTGTYDDTDEEVPIWEGDVLEIIKINDDATSQKIDAVVKWLDIFGGFVVEGINKKGSISLLGQVITDFIVYKIGNIHDNPELLKGGIEWQQKN